MRGTLLIILCFSVSLAANAQKYSERVANHPDPASTRDFAEVVVPITSLKLKPNFHMALGGQGGHKMPTLSPKPEVNLEATFGTGFCLDAACLYIATNYHVALAEPDKVQKQKIVQRYLATGPDDKEATANTLPDSDVIAYSKKRDLAILELQHPLPQHHGLSFKLDEMETREEVDIYGYPKGSIDPRRKLARFPARFKALTTSGLLAFTYERFTDSPLRIAGSSGGIVVDRKTQEIVGILSQSNETTAVAVPVQTLVEFVIKVLPFLAQRMFPEAKQIPPISTDLYPKFVPPRSEGLQRRQEEPDDVRQLRQNAQQLADSIKEFIAVQSYAWGAGDKEPDTKAAYEVRVLDGKQWFRTFPEGAKEFLADDLPPPNRKAWTVPADEWSKLPKMVGTEFKLKVQRASDAEVNERLVRVFRYYASSEMICVSLRPSRIGDFSGQER